MTALQLATILMLACGAWALWCWVKAVREQNDLLGEQNDLLRCRMSEYDDAPDDGPKGGGEVEEDEPATAVVRLRR